MAEMANKNVFYQLYNKGNNSFIGSNYRCPDLVDETDTGFTIEDNKAVITDSNGDVLQSIDLSAINATGVTQYHTETKILQPNTTYYIQGLDFGESYAQHYFKICDHIVNVDPEQFANYINLEFDVCYTEDFNPTTIHISTRSKRNPEDDVVEDITKVVNDIFCDYNLPFSASIEVLEDGTCSGNPEYYFKLMSNVQGLEFNVTNVVALPIYQSEEYPDSPFQYDAITVQDVIDALLEVKPGDDSDKIDCSLYVYLLEHMKWLFEQYVNNGDLPPILYDLPAPYDKDDVVAVIEAIIRNTGYSKVEDNTKYLHRLRENYDMQVDSLKYPNGAMRGIVLIPEWPESADEQKACLKIHHIKDEIIRYEPVYSLDADLAGVDEETRFDCFQVFEFVINGKKVKTLARYVDTPDKEPISDVYKIPAGWDGRISSLILWRAKKDNDLLKKYDGVDLYYIIDYTNNGKTNKFLVKWVNDGHPENVEDVLYRLPDNWNGKLDSLIKVDLGNGLHDLDELPEELYMKLDVKTNERIPGTAEKYENSYYLRWINDGNPDIDNLYVRRVDEDGVLSYIKYVPGMAVRSIEEDVTSEETVIETQSDFIDYVEYPKDVVEDECKEPKLLYEKKIYKVLASYRDLQNRTSKVNYNSIVSAADSNDAYQKYQYHMQQTCQSCFTKDELDKPIKESCGCFDDNRGVIGYYGYIDHINKNNDWLNVGQAYILVGGQDDADSNVKNMVPSVLLYNPYDVPIRVRYMIFA